MTDEIVDLTVAKEYQEFLNALFQEYGIEGDTVEEKLINFQSETGMSASAFYAAQQSRKDRKESAYTPLGMPREIVINAGTPSEEVVNTYDYLINNTNFVPYIKGDANDVLDSLRNDSSLKEFQQKLFDAGYLKSGSYVPGFIGESTKQALNSLFADANNAGQVYNNYLNKILLNPQYDTSLYPTEPELDYDELGNTVINTVKKQIGREPSGEEFEILLGILASYQTQEYKETLETLGPQYKREDVMFEGKMRPFGQDIERVLSTTTPSNSVAKFESKVRELFKPEMDLNQRREQTQNVANIIKSSVAGLGSIGG
jgi:hypothetical protein